jgi:hypothetical protein
MMNIAVLRNKTPAQVALDLEGFDPRYDRDWEQWLGVRDADKPNLFAAILRRWQATRPAAMRRPKNGASHGPPFIEDLLAEAESHLTTIGQVSVTEFSDLTLPQAAALRNLWRIFAGLPTTGSATCVGISKSVLLLTQGRIGPAFDSIVRQNTGLKRKLSTPDEWIEALNAVAEDIRAFEDRNETKLASVVPSRFAMYNSGRLYDMILGPRSEKTRHSSRQDVKNSRTREEIARTEIVAIESSFH